VTESGLSDNIILSQVDKVFWSKETQFVEELVFIQDGKIVRVVKRA